MTTRALPVHLAAIFCAAACSSKSGNPNTHDDSLCNGITTDLTSDPSNCGTCGNACNTGSEPYCCNSVCVDADSDPNNCGGCGMICVADAGSCCVQGECESDYQFSVDPLNCGSCGNSCGSHLCVGSTCQAQVACLNNQDCPDDGGAVESCVPSEQDGNPFLCDGASQGQIFQGCSQSCAGSGVACWTTLGDAGEVLRQYCTPNCAQDSDCYEGLFNLGLGFCCSTDYPAEPPTYQCDGDPSCADAGGACVPCL